MSHQTAALSVRERLAIPTRDLPDLLISCRPLLSATEFVVLSTCNRVEWYVVCDDPASSLPEILDVLAVRSGLSLSTIHASLYWKSGQDAVAHLFRVAAGLESMVLGESEIAAQVKQAYVIAQTQGTTGVILNRLFQKALHAAKLVRTRTSIADGHASIGSIVTALATQHLGASLSSSEALLWGAGKAAEVTARHLVAQGIRRLWVVNRTSAKAQDLAAGCQGAWVSWEQARAHLAHVELAIVCTQAPHYVIDPADLDTMRSHHREHPLLLIDLAVPRNIDPVLARQPGLSLYNIDDLEAMAHAARTQRQRAMPQADALIDEQVGYVWQWWNLRANKEKTQWGSVEACAGV